MRPSVAGGHGTAPARWSSGWIEGRWRNPRWEGARGLHLVASGSGAVRSVERLSRPRGCRGCRERSRQLPRHGEGRSIAEAAEQSHGGPLCRRRGVRGRWQQADGKGAPARPVDPEPHRRPWVRSCIFDLPNSASDGRSSPHLSCTCAYSQVSACPPPDWGRRCRKVSRPADRRHPTGSEGSPRDQPDPRSGALKP
jgi:hypothetical protein